LRNEENEASNGRAEDLGYALTLLSEAGWRAAFERAGLFVLERARLRPPPAPGASPTWKQVEGSLFTLRGR
jgi:hypothetical protein